MLRGEVWWADLPNPAGSEPGYRRPILILQADAFNRSRINTVIGIVISSNLRLANAPGNVALPARESGLPSDSVVNVSQVITVDKRFLTDRSGQVRGATLRAVEDGVRLVLSL
jgi:mRNA interferase MazF